MKVFISWSGASSRLVAEELYDYLQTFLHNAEPWLSTHDIDKGARWRNELDEVLANESVGIFVINRDNVGSPWVNFEAGSLSKEQNAAVLIPYLIEMNPRDLRGPLEPLNASTFSPGSTWNRHEFKDLVKSINKALGTSRAPDHVWTDNFERLWPEFEARLTAAVENGRKIVEIEEATNSDYGEILDALAEAVRDQSRLVRDALGDSRWTFRGNAKLDPLSRSDYRDLAVGLQMLKVLAEIESKDYAYPNGGAVSTLLRVRNPLEVILARAHAPIIRGLYFVPIEGDPAAPWNITFEEEA